MMAICLLRVFTKVVAAAETSHHPNTIAHAHTHTHTYSVALNQYVNVYVSAYCVHPIIIWYLTSKQFIAMCGINLHVMHITQV